MTSLFAGVRKAEPVDDVVQPHLENAKQVFARDTGQVFGIYKVFVELPLEDLGIDERHPYRMVDLLTGARFTWQGPRNYVELRPNEVPAHILKKE